MRRAPWLVLVLAACGSPSGSRTTPPPPTPPPSTPHQAAEDPPPPGPSAACTEQATKLGAALRDLGRAQPGFLPIVRGIHAPVSKAAKPVDKPGVVVAIAADGAMYMQGYRFVDGLQGVAEYLEDTWRRAVEKTLLDGGTAADAVMPLYIWADRAVPARTVAEVAALADAEKRGKVAYPPRKAPAKGPGKQPALADRPPPDDDPPPPEEDNSPAAARQQAIQAARDAGLIGGKPAQRPPHFLARLIVTSTDKPTALDASLGATLPASEPEASQAVVDQLKMAIGTSCDPIMTTLGTVSLEGTPEKQTAKLVADLPAGLLSCNCKVASAEGLATGMRLWFGAWAPPLQWIEVPKIKTTDKQPIGKRVK